MLFIPPSLVKRKTKKVVYFDNPVCNDRCVDETVLHAKEHIEVVRDIVSEMHNFYEYCILNNYEIRIPHIGSFQKGTKEQKDELL